MIEKLIEELTNTYDTNILDNQPDIVQKEFLTISLKNNIKGKARAADEIVTSNQVLMQLICNHYDKSVNKPIAEFIGGPRSFSIHWHPRYKKIIYIFGEEHANTMDCETFDKDAYTYPVEDYLYDLMLSTDVFLDIYLEIIPYRNGEYDNNKPYEDGRMLELFKKFKHCLQYNTRHDKHCQLARVHYFDIRGKYLKTEDIEEEKINIVWIVRKFRDYIKESAIDFWSGNFSRKFKSLVLKYPKIITFLEKLADEDIENVVKFMKEQLEEPLNTKKEFKIDLDLKTLILDFYDKLISYEMKQIIIDLRPHILTLLKYNIEQPGEYDIEQTVEAIYTYTRLAMSYYADVYLLARVFKNFDMSKMQEKAYKGSTDQPIQAHNIIIYCGDTHAINYRDCLLTIGFKDITNLNKDSVKLKRTKNCVDMRNIKQPFFSYNYYELPRQV
jgi:hypothetical protein